MSVIEQTASKDFMSYKEKIRGRRIILIEFEEHRYVFMRGIPLKIFSTNVSKFSDLIFPT